MYLKIIKERELYEKPTKEKLDNAEFFKNEGNKAIKEKEFEDLLFSVIQKSFF